MKFRNVFDTVHRINCIEKIIIFTVRSSDGDSSTPCSQMPPHLCEQSLILSPVLPRKQQKETQSMSEDECDDEGQCLIAGIDSVGEEYTPGTVEHVDQ